MINVQRLGKPCSILLLTALALGGCMRVEIENPDNGTFIDQPTVTVSGNVYSIVPNTVELDPADMYLEINGSPVAIGPDGSYSTNILLDPNIVFNPIEADVVQVSKGFVDSDRVVVIAGDSIVEGGYSPQSIALQINASGLDALEPVVSSLVDLDLPSLVPVGTTILSNECVVDSIFGCLGRATIRIANPAPSISGFGIDFTPQQNVVDANVVLSDFRLQVNIDGSGVVPDCGLRLSANALSLVGDYALEPDGTTPTRVDVAQVGSVDANFFNFNQTFTSGICDAPIIGDLIQLIIGNVEPMVVSGLEGFLNSTDGNGNTPIAGAVESALAGVDVSGPVGAALSAELDAPFFQVLETPGGITLGSDSRFITNFGTGPGQCNPPANAPDLTASYHVDQAFPSFGATTPGGTPYDIAIGISSSGFNQLLRSQIECGLLVASISELDLLGTGVPLPLTAGLLSTFVPQLATLGANAPATIELAPTIAPLVTGAPGPAGELALLKLSQLYMKVLVDYNNGAGLVEVDAADFFLDAELGIDLTVDPGTGALTFSIAPPEPTYVTAKHVENPIGADLASVEALLPQVVGTFLPALSGGLGSFPLPSFLGLSLAVVEVSRNGEFLTIYANLQ